MRLMQSCWLRLAALYSRFQALILIIFVASMVDFMVYSDAVTVLVALPELMPVVIIALLPSAYLSMFSIGSSGEKGNDSIPNSSHTLKLPGRQSPIHGNALLVWRQGHCYLPHRKATGVQCVPFSNLRPEG